MFCVKYRNFIPRNVILLMRNGEEISVELVKELGVFVGMRVFFQRFGNISGCILAF